MDAITLVLEGLPCDFDCVIPTLELYFKSKRRSGGEAAQIQENPEDKRKALLVYLDGEDAQNVLKRGVHQVAFKELGAVKLTVKMQRTAKPPAQAWRKSDPVPSAAAQPSESHKETEADLRSHSLLVRSSEPVDEGILTLYFEQFLGQVTITVHEENSWILHVNFSDFSTILAMKEHDFGITVEANGEESVVEKSDHRCFILTGFKNTCKYKLITLLINGCTQKAPHTWELVDEDRIVVTFKEDIDVNNFLTKCSARRLYGMDIHASRLELTDSVLVEGDLSVVQEDVLTGHFSNKEESGGGAIRSVLWINKHKSVVITFKDYLAAYQVVEQKHQLCGADLTVLLFYSSLQYALTGKIPSLSEIQTSIPIPVDVEVLKFIANNQQCRNDLENQLKMVHASVDEVTFPRKLVVEMDVDKDSLLALQIGPTWEKNVRRAAQEFLKKYTAAELAVEVNVWQSVESTCLGLITPEAEIFFREADCKIVIVGLTEVVDALLDEIKNAVREKTTKLIVNDTNGIYWDSGIQSTDTIPLKSLRELEFVKSIMRLSELPELQQLGASLEYSCDSQKTPFLKVTAAKEKILDATRLIKKKLSSIVVEKLTYSKPGESKVLDEKEANVQAKAKEWSCKLYFEQLIKCGPAKSFQHEINSCITLTIAEGDLHHWTADALVCPMATSLAFDNPTAQQFLEVGGPQIKEVCNRLQREKQALLAGDVVVSNSGNLGTKALIYAVLPESCQSLSTHYLKSAIINSLHKAEEKSSDTVALPVLGFGTFGFSIKESCTAIIQAILEFVSDPQNSPKNMQNIFVVDSDVKVIEEFNILVAKLGFSSVITSACPVSTSAEVTTPEMKPTFKSEASVTVHGVLVCLKKGDITKETVDVIVNSTNRDLDLSAGLCGAIFKAAGKSIENEYKLSDPTPGDVTITGGGNLSCKYIAQMFGPRNAADLAASIEKVLQLCETTKAATVAIPAIGTGGVGISGHESIRAIFTALENHLVQQNSSWLKKITVVTFEQSAWEAFLDYFKERNRKSLTKGMPAHLNQVKIEGATIKIKKGDITDEITEAIVNTTNREMNLKTGVSGAIFRKAGPYLEKECRKLEPLVGDMVALTSPGNLRCGFIIHMMGPHSATAARLRVKKVLERCEQKRITSVSFPAVGTGGGGLRGVDAMSAMLQAFEDYFSEHLSSVVKHIYVVVDRDEVLHEFQQGLKDWTTDIQESGDEDEDDNDGEACLPEEEYQRACPLVSFSFFGFFTMFPGLCLFRRAPAEHFWNPETGLDVDKLDPELKQVLGGFGVSEEQLKDKRMRRLIFDCIQEKGGLQAFKEGLKKEVDLMQMVGAKRQDKSKGKKNKKQKKRLSKADIGMPETFEHISHMGFDVDSLDPELKNMFSTCGISEAQLTDKETFKVIYDFIEKKGGVEAVKKQFRRDASKPTQANETHPSPAREPLSLPSEMATISFPAATVVVYGTSPAGLAKVKKHLDDLISDGCTSKDIQFSHLASLQEAEKEAIVALSRNNQVHILLASSDKLIVSGKKDDVLDALLNISTLNQAVKDRETHECEKKRLSKTVCWEVAEGETWVPLDCNINYQLELAFHRKEQSFICKEEGEAYTANFKDLTWRNSSGRSCRIRRTLIGDSDIAIIQPPPTWTKMEETDLEMIALLPGSGEYKKIAARFLSSCQKDSIPSVQIVKICRIQNRQQWQRYCVLKQAVDKKYPNQINEQFLYHGTTQEISQRINKNGFNRSFCGRNAVVHGEGTYFAKEAWYSCQDQYSNPDANGLKYIYRARVVTGSPCKSRQGMKEPDPLDPKDPRAGLHDCAVDNLKNPFIFVVFCDAGAYPDYLITFRNV
ncbi:protein mono-ADP-ribosyltransferase PARP14-like [Salminus brasiliensis]|uniref:protein mono-ADP-ribosyltransferase PARP14-like n=1 Tax=Salminus brasiliensis TaxID=930266 RepID=UPI003B82F2DF